VRKKEIGAFKLGVKNLKSFEGKNSRGGLEKGTSLPGKRGGNRKERKKSRR